MATLPTSVAAGEAISAAMFNALLAEVRRLGQRLEAVVRARFAPLLASRPVGVTLQIDEGPEVFDAKNSSLHPLFSKPA